MSEVLNRPVLVLNKHWLAVHVCTARRALALVYESLAKVVTEDYETYDFESWIEFSAAARAGEPLIHTPNFSMRPPQVIVLGRYQRVPPRTVRFNRRNIFLRDGYRCQYCGRRPDHDDLSVDHVVPRSRGGASTWDNVVLACTRCNARKGNQLPEECGMRPKNPPRRPAWLAALRIVPHGDQRPVWEKFVDLAYWESELRE